MRTFYVRPDSGAFLVALLFFFVGLSQVAPPFFGHNPSEDGTPVPLVWTADTVCRFCFGSASIVSVWWVWPRPYWVTVSERGIRRVYGAGPFWGDRAAERFSVSWQELREWRFRTEPVQDGEEWFPYDFVYISDASGRQFRLHAFSSELRDELRRWAPEKEQIAEAGAAPDTPR